VHSILQAEVSRQTLAAWADSSVPPARRLHLKSLSGITVLNCECAGERGARARRVQARSAVSCWYHGLAAIQLGRRFTGIDLSHEFVHLAVARLAQAVADLGEA
jgi:hypothetical protein